MSTESMSQEKNAEEELFEDLVDESSAADEQLEIELPESGTEDLINQLKDAEGRALRSQAELENFRVRVRREQDDQLKYSNQKLLTEMLPVIDNMYRAVSAASQNPQSANDGLLEGVLMVSQQLLDTLKKFHCTRIEAVGNVFDPNQHEAISQMPSDQYEAGHVIQVVQEGYLLHERVIRPAHVIISTGPEEAAAATPANDPASDQEQPGE